MIKVFAKQGTSEKVIVTCFTGKQITIMQTALNRKYGGNWTPVDELKPTVELLHFDDGLVYLGYQGTGKRYINGIEPLFKEG